MAKRRTIKRKINQICNELMSECIAVSLYCTNVNEENTDALLRTIAKSGRDYVCRVSHPEPGMTAKAYFRELTERFNENVNDIIDHINNLC